MLSRMSLGIAGGGSPLHNRTWDLDRDEGNTAQLLKSTSLEPLAEPLIEVPEDLKAEVLRLRVEVAELRLLLRELRDQR